jgi:quercetin dioxygenase-like cupin family protein
MRPIKSKNVYLIFLLTAVFTLSAVYASAGDLIWPDPAYVSNPNQKRAAIPEVEKVSICMKKYGKNDWRTWRAQYFENRLALPDDGYRYEHTNFQAALDRGMNCNIWTGTPFPIYGMSGESSRLILYPLTGSESQQFQSAALHIGESCDKHSQYHSETIIAVWHGQGELFIHDQWIPVTAGDLGYVPVGCPMAWRVPKNSPKDMVLFIITAPCPFNEYIKTGMMKPVTDKAAKEREWMHVWKWVDPAATGLLGHPDFVRYPHQR